MNEIDKSHRSHQNLILEMAARKDDYLSIVKNKDSIGYHINLLTVAHLKPFLNTTDSWLTVGDYNGYEAHHIGLHSSGRVVGSDISDAMLQEAKKDRLIAECKAINAEAIDYEDNSFDYVCCREAFHHFPKAFVGLYEMIRVAKKAAIILEPHDITARFWPMTLLKNILDIFDDSLINKFWKNRFSFESVGNYVFKISERDIEKIAMGMGLPCVAIKPVNILLESVVRDKYNGSDTLASKQASKRFMMVFSKRPISVIFSVNLESYRTMFWRVLFLSKCLTMNCYRVSKPMATKF
jgi:Methyltransferase domain